MAAEDQGIYVLDDVKVLRISAVKRMVGLSRTTIWRLERDGRFPRRRLIGIRAIGWAAVDIRDWIESREKSEICIKVGS